MRPFLHTSAKFAAATLLAASFLFSPVFFAAAQTPANSGYNQAPANSGLNEAPANSGYNSSGNCGQTSDANTLQNPLAVCSISDLIALLLHAAIIIGIPIAVLFIVYAGFKFILARGSPGALSEARSNLIATLIGVAIFVGASLIANVIIATLHQLGVNGINSY